MQKSYRSELDGLRALAVISVIIYHANLSIKGVPLLTGGFLGVDIFFVLSGFLITGILIDKQPTLLQFYKSRIDRIYPALLLMLFLSSILAYLFLIPEDLLNFAKQIKGAFLFYSNYIFMHEDSYIADSSQYKVLLHTWSLGVEWQYYLVFPFIVFGIRKFFREQFEQILVLLFAISFFYYLYLMNIDSTFAFYSTFARVWELFVGGIVFLISRYLKNSKFDDILSVLGVVAILYSLIFFKDTDIQSGFISLIAVIGASIFILFTKENSFIYKIATLKISVFFGVISYSLYLYHQPILVFYRFNQCEIIENKIFIVLFIVMVLISYLSYRFFENPIRKSRDNRKYFIILFLALFVFVFYKGIKYTKGFENRISEDVRDTLQYFDEKDWLRLKSDIKGYEFSGKEVDFCNKRVPKTACIFKGDENSKELVIIGDSYGGVFSYILQEYKPKLSLVALYYNASPLLANPIWVNKKYPELWEINKERWKIIEKMKPTNILVGTNFEQFSNAQKSLDNFSYGQENLKEKVSKEDAYKSFRKSIEKLISLGHNPIILLQPPKPNKDIAKEQKRQIFSGVLNFKDKYDAKPTTSIDNEVKDALKGLNVTFIDINSKMCQGDKCLTFNKNGGLYKDGQHLSFFGVKLFVKEIINSLK